LSLNIKDAKTHALARELAAATGETITKAVHIAIQKRLHKVRKRQAVRRPLADRLDEIAKHCAALPVVRGRPADEILGYDDHGLPPLMVIDTSAVLAILLGEPEQRLSTRGSKPRHRDERGPAPRLQRRPSGAGGAPAQSSSKASL
jgi:antitoxin VapB